jgi:hypothetical protein
MMTGGQVSMRYRTRGPDTPVVFFVFDILMDRGRDLKGLPLSDRRALLAGNLIPSDLVQRSEHFLGSLSRFVAAVRRSVAKIRGLSSGNKAVAITRKLFSWAPRRAEEQCCVKRGSHPRICGVHDILLIRKQLPNELIVAGYKGLTVLVCPVSEAVLNDEPPRQSTGRRSCGLCGQLRCILLAKFSNEWMLP